MPVRLNRRIVTVHEARAILDAAALPIDRTELVGLIDLGGRVLAQPITARTDVPPFARSAMDGYAVIASDVAGATPDRPVRLALLEQVFTGSVPSLPVTSGSCTAVATGAPIPAGADAVVMVEHTSADASGVAILASIAPGTHVNPQGSDLRAGQVVLREGAYLTPSRLGTIAAAGYATATVFARPRVAIVVTGDEVVTPGQPLAPGQVHDINTATLAAAVREHGGEPGPQPVVADDRDAIREAFERALEADLVLVSGGSSVGERDYILEIIAEQGDVRFEGIALKPGKPTVFAVARGRPVFGMPGNPTSCLSNAYLLVAPLLRRVARLPPAVRRTVQAKLARRISSPAGRHQFYTVSVVNGEAHPAFKGSGDITSMADADGYFEIEADTETVEAGEIVEVTLF